MTLDEAIERYTSNAEYERTHGNLQGYLEFKILVNWLQELKEYREIIQPEKTGQWFAWKPEDDVWRTSCSECGEETRTLWKYCPNCGAKMEVYKDDRQNKKT